MKKLVFAALLFTAPAFAQSVPPKDVAERAMANAAPPDEIDAQAYAAYWHQMADRAQSDVAQMVGINTSLHKKIDALEQQLAELKAKGGAAKEGQAKDAKAP